MRRWITAIVLGALASALIAIPASAEDAPERNQVRAQEQVRVQEDECVADCEPLRDQEQERDQARLGSDDAIGRTDECGGDCRAVDPELERVRDQARDQSRANTPEVDDFEGLLQRIRACIADGGADCPDPDVVMQRIRLMLAEDDVPLPRLCLRLWNWWRFAL